MIGILLYVSAVLAAIYLILITALGVWVYARIKDIELIAALIAHPLAIKHKKLLPPQVSLLRVANFVRSLALIAGLFAFALAFISIFFRR